MSFFTNITSVFLRKCDTNTNLFKIIRYLMFFFIYFEKSVTNTTSIQYWVIQNEVI